MELQLPSSIKVSELKVNARCFNSEFSKTLETSQIRLLRIILLNNIWSILDTRNIEHLFWVQTDMEKYKQILHFQNITRCFNPKFPNFFEKCRACVQAGYSKCGSGSMFTVTPSRLASLIISMESVSADIPLETLQSLVQLVIITFVFLVFNEILFR